jgi:hypothetical protein
LWNYRPLKLSKKYNPRRLKVPKNSLLISQQAVLSLLQRYGGQQVYEFTNVNDLFLSRYQCVGD